MRQRLLVRSTWSLQGVSITNIIHIPLFSQPMSVTKALGTLNLVSARGLDNGTAGALALANQESFCKYKHDRVFQNKCHFCVFCVFCDVNSCFLHRRATDCMRLRRVGRRMWRWKKSRRLPNRDDLTNLRFFCNFIFDQKQEYICILIVKSAKSQTELTNLRKLWSKRRRLPSGQAQK